MIGMEWSADSLRPDSGCFATPHKVAQWLPLLPARLQINAILALESTAISHSLQISRHSPAHAPFSVKLHFHRRLTATKPRDRSPEIRLYDPHAEGCTVGLQRRPAPFIRPVSSLGDKDITLPRLRNFYFFGLGAFP